MPKKVVTKQTNGSYKDEPAGFSNFCNAIAESIGATATINTSAPPYSASISMSSVGYPELTIKIKNPGSGYTNYVSITIENSDIGGGIRIDDDDAGNGWILYDSSDYPRYNAFTAICARDSNNDSVAIAVTSGTDPSKSETGTNYGRAPVVLFAGKDTNENILFGGGTNNGCVTRLRCGSNFATAVGFTSSPSYSQTVQNVLHFTKMINYLADGYPEMKSAYISVVRPYSTDPKKDFKNLSYYSEGALWFIAGESMTRYYYPPYNPVIKY